jgi:hypothetical protein
LAEWRAEVHKIKAAEAQRQQPAVAKKDLTAKDNL